MIIVVQVHMILYKVTRKTSVRMDIFPLSTVFTLTFVFTLQICRCRDSQSASASRSAFTGSKKRISNSYTSVCFVFPSACMLSLNFVNAKKAVQ